MNHKEIEKAFTYHPPLDDDQITRYKLIRDAGKAFAITIKNCTPECADQTAAIRKVREAVMTANAAIAINEAPDSPTTTTYPAEGEDVGTVAEAPTEQEGPQTEG